MSISRISRNLTDRTGSDFASLKSFTGWAGPAAREIGVLRAEPGRQPVAFVSYAPGRASTRDLKFHWPSRAGPTREIFPTHEDPWFYDHPLHPRFVHEAQECWCACFFLLVPSNRMPTLHGNTPLALPAKLPPATMRFAR